MPGRYFLTAPIGEVAAFLGHEPAVASPIRMAHPALCMPRHNVAPGQSVICGTDAGLVTMRWGMIPVGRRNARGRPVMETLINARSETVFAKSAFEGVRRCLVPAGGWYEWTGVDRRKTAWRIVPKTGGLIAFAGIYDIWRAPGGSEVAQVATVTCPPSADVRDIHHRMGVIVSPGDFSTWVGGAEVDAAGMMRPWPDGLLDVTHATDVDWSAA